MAKTERNRHWDAYVNFHHARFFRDWGLDLSGSGGPVIHLNPGLVWALLTERLGAVILGGYDSATTVMAAFVLKIRKIPLLFWIESTLGEETLVRRIIKPALRAIIRMGIGVVVPGSASREYARSLGVEDERLFVAPNSIDIKTFAPGTDNVGTVQAKTRFGLTNGPVCLYVGRLDQRKGIIDLLSAFKHVVAAYPKAQLLIVGDGPLKHALSSFVSANPDLRGSVVLGGHCPYDQLPQVYACADIFVFPTHKDVWGMVINEAMSMGLPVVSSSGAGGTTDLVVDGVTGFVVSPRNSDELAEAILKLMGDPSARTLMGQRGRDRILKGFSPEIQGRAILDAIRLSLLREPSV